jgi:hypothetical protein
MSPLEATELVNGIAIVGKRASRRASPPGLAQWRGLLVNQAPWHSMVSIVMLRLDSSWLRQPSAFRMAWASNTYLKARIRRSARSSPVARYADAALFATFTRR